MRHTAVRQWAGSFQVVPTRPVNPALYKTKYMFDKDKFHNQLALNLGYQCIVNDKRIDIRIDDKQYPNDVMITISFDSFSKLICYKASEGLGQNDMDRLDENSYDDIKIIVDAVHQAYIDSTREGFSCYDK